MTGQPDPPLDRRDRPHDNCNCALAPAGPGSPINWRVTPRPLRWNTMEAAKWRPRSSSR